MKKLVKNKKNNEKLKKKNQSDKEGMQREVGVTRCKLLCTEWMNNILLYSTENYIQYSMINYNGKNILKKNVYISKSLCCIVEINTKL